MTYLKWVKDSIDSSPSSSYKSEMLQLAFNGSTSELPKIKVNPLCSWLRMSAILSSVCVHEPLNIVAFFMTDR